MTRAQRLAGEHCGRRTTGTSSTSLGSCPASDFVELLGATRAETSGLARCHGAADEIQNGCVQKTGCLKVILERTMASVPNWSEMRHSDLIFISGSKGVQQNNTRTRYTPTHHGVGMGCFLLRKWLFFPQKPMSTNVHPCPPMHVHPCPHCFSLRTSPVFPQGTLVDMGGHWWTWVDIGGH